MSKLFSIRCLQKVSPIVSLFLLIILPFSVSSQNAKKKICQTEECLAAVKTFKESINFDADPCNDFYKYACGNWLRNSDTVERSIILSREAENSLEILDFLKQNNSNDEPKAVHKARKLFSLCLNEEAYKNDLEQIETTLRNIGIPVSLLHRNEKLDYDYTKALARAVKLTGTNLYFHLEVLPNLYNLTADTISLTVQESNSSKSKSEEQNKYEKTKKMCGNKPSPSCKQLLLLLSTAQNLTTEETLNQKSESPEIDTESNSITLNSSLPITYDLKQLQKLTDDIAAKANATIPTFNWVNYIEELLINTDNVTLNLNDTSKIQITISELDSVTKMIQNIHKRQDTKVIAYEILREVIYTLQPYVDSTEKTEKNCARRIETLFTWAASYMYTTKEKYTKAKTEGREMFERLREIFHQLIQQATWMDEKTKQRALKKLHWLRSNIAYPSIISNTSSLDDFYKDVQITDNFYDSILSLNLHQNRRKIEDRRDDDWSIPPTDVNAYYNYTINSIYIPAGYLGFIFYNGLDVLRYGAIGRTIGHEMAHAFDNNGRRYNETGNVEDWWQPETEKLYKEKAKCFFEAKRNYNANSNGSRPGEVLRFSSGNLGEDLSDNVGFKESLLAYRNSTSVSGEEPSLPQFENFTHEQLFTLAFATFRCENLASSKASSARVDIHSSSEFRINGVLQNSREFSEIWKCPKGSKMNPDDKCTLW